jgi:hypothetical protein
MKFHRRRLALRPQAAADVDAGGGNPAISQLALFAYRISLAPVAAK